MSLPVTVVKNPLLVIGYQQITSLSSAAKLASKSAISALIQAETKDVRWRDDGVAPTSSVGMVLKAGDTLEYSGDLTAIQFIEAESSAKLNIAYYGREIS